MRNPAGAPLRTEAEDGAHRQDDFKVSPTPGENLNDRAWQDLSHRVRSATRFLIPHSSQPFDDPACCRPRPPAVNRPWFSPDPLAGLTTRRAVDTARARPPPQTLMSQLATPLPHLEPPNTRRSTPGHTPSSHPSTPPLSPLTNQGEEEEEEEEFLLLLLLQLLLLLLLLPPDINSQKSVP